MTPLQSLEAHVTKLANDPGFIHHAWFIEHHLKIIEQMVNELCDRHPAANRTACLAMVWLHDLGKILTNKQASAEQELQVTLAESTKLLTNHGFVAADTALVLKALEEMEHLKTQPVENLLLETKIISSTDAAAHYVGPFFALYWYENPQKEVAEIIQSNLTKLAKDQRKALLPEVTAFLQPRFVMLTENDSSQRPTHYFS